MSVRTAHPEELIERARRGVASEAELGELAEHFSHCPSCRFESAIASDAKSAALPRVSDELVVARIRRSTARALLARGARPRRRRARSLLLVAAALLVGSASLAGVLGYRAFAARTAAAPARTTATLARPPARAPLTAAAPRPAPPSAPPTAPVAAPSVSAVQVAEPARALAAQATRSAADLFAEANRDRRTGRVAEAARGYRELTQRFPGSPEASVARVSFGRLLLDRLGNARGALAEFDSYLNGSSHRALREEALIGRAVALGRLGRSSEERAAWRTLLRTFPSSTYATRARARLDALDAGASAP